MKKIQISKIVAGAMWIVIIFKLFTFLFGFDI